MNQVQVDVRFMKQVILLPAAHDRSEKAAQQQLVQRFTSRALGRRYGDPVFIQLVANLMNDNLLNLCTADVEHPVSSTRGAKIASPVFLSLTQILPNVRNNLSKKGRVYPRFFYKSRLEYFSKTGSRQKLCPGKK